MVVVCIFFCKQKTAYDMRISDWSSDVCSSDLVRQHRETDYSGNFIKRQTKPAPKGQGSKTMESAFDFEKGYELTELGKQFVHYAMTEITARIAFDIDRKSVV